MRGDFGIVTTIGTADHVTPTSPKRHNLLQKKYNNKYIFMSVTNMQHNLSKQVKKNLAELNQYIIFVTFMCAGSQQEEKWLILMLYSPETTLTVTKSH